MTVRRRDYSPPPARGAEIPRLHLLSELAAREDCAVVSVVAPAGYGKTLLVAQWCRQDRRESAWIALRAADNDPVLLLRRLAAALEEIEAIDPGLSAELDEPAPLQAALTRLLDSLGRRAPFRAVLDDVQLVDREGSLDVIRALVAAVPDHSQLVLVSRSDPPLGLARRRVAGELYEIRSTELAFDEAEAAHLVTSAGLVADHDVIARLCNRTEGWAAGVALATMAARDPGAPLAGLSGAHPHLAAYFSEEVLARQTAEVRGFLLETCLLERLSGSLCDEVTGRRDSSRVLRALEAASLFIVPLDERREWYRYHHLFQDLLRAELPQHAEIDTAGLLSRAAAWHEHHGDPAEAFDYSRQGGDFERAGRVLLGTWDDYTTRGLVETLVLWVNRCGEDDIASDPQLALGAAFVTLQVGEVERANRYLVDAQGHDLDRPSADGATSLRASMLNLRATLAPLGVAQMLEDGRAVVASESAQRTRWLVGGYRNVAVAELASSHPVEAIEALNEVLRLTEQGTAGRHVRLACLGVLALALLDLGELAEAERRTREAEEILGEFAHNLQSAPVVTARACLAATSGDTDTAIASLTRMHDLLPFLLAVPCVQSELALRCSNAARALGDLTLARALLSEARLAVALLADAGTLRERIEAAGAPMVDLDPRLALLSPAEARVLRLLATHQTLQEIAARLFVSRSTVKTQVAAIYAKLGVSSRADAVRVARPDLFDEDASHPMS